MATSVRAFTAAFAVVVLGAACGNTGSPARDLKGREQPIVIASFDFSESKILGEIYARALEQGGFPIERLPGVATREIMEPALEQGQVDLVLEYLGSSLAFLDGSGRAPSQPEVAYEKLSLALSGRGLAALDFARAQDRNEIVVTAATAARYELRSISDLRAIAAELDFGGPPECPARPLCLQGLERTYELSFRSFVSLDASGPLTVGALETGDVDVALLFSTHPAIAGERLVVLEDDLGLQPAENIVPVVRSAIVRRFGAELTSVIDSVTARLTTRALARLNEQVDVGGEDPALVAREWLEQEGLLR